MPCFLPSPTAAAQLAAAPAHLHLCRLFSSSAAAAAPVTAQAVKKLRDITGSSMGHCRQALAESDGDLERAMEWLKKRNVAAAKTRWEKVEDGMLPEGLIAIAVGPKKGVLVHIGAETDFVAKNEVFQQASIEAAHNVLENEPEKNEFLLSQISGKVGESVRLMGSTVIEGEEVVG